MPLLIGTRRALLYAGGIPYLLNDSFTGELAAGSVNGTAAAPGPGTRTVVDTGSKLSLSGGNMVNGARTGNGDPGLWLDAVTRAAGVLMVAHANFSNNGNNMEIGWGADQSGFLAENAFYNSSGSLYAMPKFGTLIASIAASRDYYFAIVLRSTGAYYFIKESTDYATWTLLWHEATKNTATVYPAVAVRTSWSSGNNISSFLRVPEATWLPEPLAYDTFTDDNSTSLDAHASDTTGPDSQGTTSRSWTEQIADWDIQSNEANSTGAASGNLRYLATVDAGEADVVVDVDVTLTADATQASSIVLRYGTGPDCWTISILPQGNDIKIYEWDDDSATERATAAVVINVSTTYSLRAIADGQVIDGFVDGGNKVSYGSAALNETSTLHGIRAYEDGETYNNFTIFARSDGFETLDKYTR